ncbi:MAG: hypothetical protein ACRDY7_09705 [Acidimicrobiia bacterium]
MSEGIDGASAGAPLTPLLRDSMVTWDELDRRYHALLQLVDKLLGVVPNCDPYLEIWPPAFRTYNIMVPNLLNLPVPVFGIGGPPPGVVGLAMYVASRTAECPTARRTPARSPSGAGLSPTRWRPPCSQAGRPSRPASWPPSPWPGRSPASPAS